MGRKKKLSDEDLLAAARTVFIEKGIATPTKLIAKCAGVSEGVLFQRYHTKEELFFAAMVPPPVDLQRQLCHRSTVGTPFSRILRITFTMVDYFRGVVPILLPLITHPSFQFDEFARRHPETPFLIFQTELGPLLQAEKKAGRIGSVDPMKTALLLACFAYSVATFEHLGAHGGKFPKQLIRGAVHSLWNGLRPTKQNPKK